MKYLESLGFREANPVDRYAYSGSNCMMIRDSSWYVALVDLPSWDSDGRAVLSIQGCQVCDLISFEFDKWYVEYLRELLELLDSDTEYKLLSSLLDEFEDKGREYREENPEEWQRLRKKAELLQNHYTGFFERSENARRRSLNLTKDKE